MRRRRRVVLLALALALGTALGGCAIGSGRSGPEVQVATGNNGSIAWQASTYVSGQEGLCLQVRVTGSDPSIVCGLDTSSTGSPITWSIDTEAGTIVAVMTDDAKAAGAVLVMANDTRQPVQVATAPAITTLRYFVVAVPSGAAAKELEIQGAGGESVAVAPLP